jgi:hypothetical protein
MEQTVLIKSLRENSHGSKQIHDQLVEHYQNKALSYLDVSYWARQFPMGRESAEY